MAVSDIHQIPVWDDDYVYLAHDPETGAAAVGMSGGDPVAMFAEVRGRKDRFWNEFHRHEPDCALPE